MLIARTLAESDTLSQYGDGKSYVPSMILSNNSSWLLLLLCVKVVTKVFSSTCNNTCSHGMYTVCKRRLIGHVHAAVVIVYDHVPDEWREATEQNVGDDAR